MNGCQNSVKICLECLKLSSPTFFPKQGAKKDGKAPDGSSYLESAESDSVKKALLE